MKKTSHAVTIEHSYIRDILELLLDLFTKIKNLKETIENLKHDLRTLIESNEDFENVIRDYRESLKQYMVLITLCLSFLIDFFLLANAIACLTRGSNLGSIFKILLPLILVCTEVVISYFAALRQRDGNRGSWVSRNLQYLVIILIIALSALVIVYSLTGYTPEVDGTSRLGFFFGSVLVQALLLIPAIMLHLWIVFHAGQITEAIAFFRYKLARARLVRKIACLEKKLKSKLLPKFLKLTHQFAMRYDRFKQAHSDADSGFERSTPVELSRAINTIMGRPLLSAPAYSETQTLDT